MSTKVFISLPMHGKTDDEVFTDLNYYKTLIASNWDFRNFGQLEFVDNLVSDDKDNKNESRLWYLGEAIKKLANCNVVVLCGDYYNYRGCRCEEFVASQYDIDTITIDNYINMLQAFKSQSKKITSEESNNTSVKDDSSDDNKEE